MLIVKGGERERERETYRQSSNWLNFLSLLHWMCLIRALNINLVLIADHYEVVASQQDKKQAIKVEFCPSCRALKEVQNSGVSLRQHDLRSSKLSCSVWFQREGHALHE